MMLDAALKDYVNKSAEFLMTTSATLPENSFASYSFSYVCGNRVSCEQFMKAQKCENLRNENKFEAFVSLKF